MRNATSIESPNLFTAELLNGNATVEDPVESTQQSVYARDFVRWCCSFGNEFRNSPDITNLRNWMRKEGIDPTASEEEGILMEARRLFLKKVEQAVRKVDVPKDKD
jgi:hypothetical protein